MAYLVELIEQLQAMRVPLSSSQGLHLANSLISGTSTQQAVLDWKQKFCVPYQLKGSKDLGAGYWRGFKRRNPDVFSKTAVKFDSKRAEWCTYQNMDNMYNEVYEKMVTNGIATKLPEPVWRDQEGNIVETEAEAFGCKSAYHIICKDKLLFVDEVGSNTNQTKDGQIGGEKFLVIGAGSRPQQKAATKDSHFTTLGFTNANGEPVMCAIIFAAKKMDISWQLGIDHAAPWEGDESDFEKNVGFGKRHPLGPECEVNGKKGPMFLLCNRVRRHQWHVTYQNAPVN
jgi:hypothetical protein